MIVTDAVFCMDGDVAPLEALVETGARVIVDEAHATGVIGADRPRARRTSSGSQVDVVTIGTLGKALGSYGAFVCCDARDRRRARQPRAHADLLDRAAAAVASAPRCEALELMDRDLVGRLHANARMLREALGVEVSDMPIVPLIVGAPEDALAASDAALRARRLRAGDPPADRPRGHVAAAPRRHRRPRSGRSPARRCRELA